MVVKLPGVVQAVHRGAKLSVLITRLVSSEQDGMRTDTKFEDRPESLSGSREKPDLYTSGPYIVKDIDMNMMQLHKVRNLDIQLN